jgi:hypothetical protein
MSHRDNWPPNDWATIDAANEVEKALEEAYQRGEQAAFEMAAEVCAKEQVRLEGIPEARGAVVCKYAIRCLAKERAKP